MFFRAVKIFILLGLLSNSSYSAQAAEMESHAYLRKLSRRLKNRLPEPKEYEALQNSIEKGSAANFLDSTIDEYLKSEEFADVMTSKLQELFRLNQYSEDRLSTTAGLFRSLAKENKSWDELATGKEYHVFSRRRPANGKSGAGFFSVAASDEIPVSNDGAFSGFLKDQGEALGTVAERVIKFKNADDRIAGAITTEDFFDRYVDTTVNKGRQRAAAIFRIFMCENLQPIIENGGDTKKHAGLKLAFPENFPLTDIQGPNYDNGLHGQRADCFACHRKLDPAGKHFQNSRIVLGPRAAAGALVYDDENGREVVVPTSGIGDFAKAIVRTSKYSECQVEHFWNWFVGSDIDLNNFLELKHSLGEQFSKNRRVQDFVKYLVKLPEFKGKPIEPEVQKMRFGQIAPALRRCNSCHESKHIPNFSRLPFENENGDHVYWIAQIKDRVSRAEGDLKKMPPRNSPDDVSRIKKWIADGALSDDGKRTIP